MSFTEHYNKDNIGKQCTIYLSNRRYYCGIIEAITKSFIRINGIDFNTEHIVSLSIVGENNGCKNGRK